MPSSIANVGEDKFMIGCSPFLSFCAEGKDCTPTAAACRLVETCVGVDPDDFPEQEIVFLLNQLDAEDRPDHLQRVYGLRCAGAGAWTRHSECRKVCCPRPSCHAAALRAELSGCCCTACMCDPFAVLQAGLRWFLPRPMGTGVGRLGRD